jgi:integrase
LGGFLIKYYDDDYYREINQMLLNSNIHPKIVSENLGHSKIDITLNIYSHTDSKIRSKAAQALDDSGILKPKKAKGKIS